MTLKHVMVLIKAAEIEHMPIIPWRNQHDCKETISPGYIEYVELEDLDQGRENGSQGGDVIVPYHISKAACYVEDARDGRYFQPGYSSQYYLLSNVGTVF